MEAGQRNSQVLSSGWFTMPLPAQCALLAAAGILSHIGVFIRGEHHLQAPFLFRLYLLLAIALLLSQSAALSYNMKEAAYTSTYLISSYAAALFSSMTVYRVFFHRLRDFPGPPLAKVSKLWHMSKVLDAKQYLFLDGLRMKYGDYVRTGPNELTIFDPKAVTAIHGPDSTCTKADWYDNLKPLTAINTTRFRTVHDKRRKIWDMGFSQKALDAYEPRVLHYAEQLATALRASEGKPVNASAWFSYLAFDIMSDLSFGKPFHMVRDGKSHHVRDLLIKGIMVLGPLTPVPWLFHLAGSLPRMTKDWLAYRAWVLVQLKERMQMETEKSNVMSWLIQASQQDDKWDMSWLEGDAVSMIVAGSEPEASTLVFLFYYLAKLPEKQKKLRLELEAASFPTDARALQSLPFLNGCIYETLRLHPPLPSGCLRITPSEGLNVDGKWIPGSSTVLTPAYSLGRLESCFEDAQQYVPERWDERPDMLKDKTAWIPFNIGRYGCVGRNLGLIELRIVTAILVAKFDIGFAPGDDGTELLEDTRDAFASAPGKLELVFQKR